MFALFLVKVLTLHHEKGSLEKLTLIVKRYVYNINLTECVERILIQYILLIPIPKMISRNSINKLVTNTSPFKL